MTTQASSTVQVPRVAIKFCTQCKWNLRAAYVSVNPLDEDYTVFCHVFLSVSSKGYEPCETGLPAISDTVETPS